MNRDRLKQAIKKLVIQEITQNTFGTPIENPDKKLNLDAEKKLKAAMGKDADMHCPTGTGKISGRTDKQTVTLSKNTEDCYDVVSVTNESERKIARGISLEAAMELVKQHAKDSEKTYVQKAYQKGKEILKKKENENVEEVSSKTDEDEMEEVKEKTQLDIADKETQKADYKLSKETTPINKDLAPALGGNIVDKIEKIVDKVLKDKAEPKSAYLKHDKSTESPDKLSVKLKDTPALKEKKS